MSVMKPKLTGCLLLLMAVVSHAQKKFSPKNATLLPAVVNEYAAIDKAALQIPDSVTKTSEQLASFITAHFNTKNEKVRAAFIWIAANIHYDYKNMYFFNPYEGTEERIKKPLETRKGVCENYARLFQDITSRCGFQSYVIAGLSRQNGGVDDDSHAWCAVRDGEKWFLYDPTWASGYLETYGTTDCSRIPYYKIVPAAFVRSHMPFDFMWQFLNYPVSRQSFIAGKVLQDSSQPVFHFEDTLLAFEKLTGTDRLMSELNRIERNGSSTKLVTEQTSYINQRLEAEASNLNLKVYNLSISYCNKAVNCLNEFIDYRNHRFKPTRPDSVIKGMLDSVAVNLHLARTTLIKFNDSIKVGMGSKAEAEKSIDVTALRMKEEQEWLKRYFAPGKMFRSLRF